VNCYLIKAEQGLGGVQKFYLKNREQKCFDLTGNTSDPVQAPFCCKLLHPVLCRKPTQSAVRRTV